MTRFKELRRIENAIEHVNNADLEWALTYCQQRLSIATMKGHQKHWKKLINQVETAIAELDD